MKIRHAKKVLSQALRGYVFVPKNPRAFRLAATRCSRWNDRQIRNRGTRI